MGKLRPGELSDWPKEAEHVVLLLPNFIALDRSLLPAPPMAQPGLWEDVPSPFGLGGKSPFSEGQKSLEKHFPSLKGFGRKLAQLPKL